MKKAAGIIILLLITNLIPVFPADAQDGDGKRTPIDSYPLPNEPGAARYSLADRWDHTDLTYYFHNCPSSLDCSTAYQVVRQAFLEWADVSALTFTEVNRAATADIEISWTTRDEEFGEPGDVLAFAYFPSYGGDLFFDDAEYWTVFGGETDLYITAVHEIGHTLGLDHTDDESAVMYPYLMPLDGLGEDDIAGIQRLYGPKEATGNEPDVVTSGSPNDFPTSDTVEVVDDSINNRAYYDLWTIDAKAGETITFTAETTSGDLDVYLGLLTPDEETILAEDDDSLGGTDAMITYTFSSAGDYVVVVTRYEFEDGDTTGSYRLTAYRDAVASAPPVPNTPVPTTIVLTLSNYSGAALCGVWISPSSSDNWGMNWLPSAGVTMLNADQYAWWPVPPDTYDITVADCFGDTLEMYLLTVMDDTEVRVYPSGLVVP
jgi:hypothetical protein